MLFPADDGAVLYGQGSQVSEERYIPTQQLSDLRRGFSFHKMYTSRRYH
jgi:hypothetical protein